MSRVCTWIFLALLSVCTALPDKSGYGPTSEPPNKHSPQEDRLLVNIVRGWNSSKVLDARGNESELGDKSNDKRARTTIPGSGSQTRDKLLPSLPFPQTANSPRISPNRTIQSASSSCCVGARYNSNGSVRPDPHYSRIPQDGRVPTSQYTPVDRHGWQTLSRPSGSSGSTGRPGATNYGSNYGGSYGGNNLYATSHSGDRFSTRPTPGGEHNGRPGNYGSGGYGYGSGSYGGFGRPTSQGGGGHYGISGTLADGEEFGPGDPGFPEASPPPHSNFQTQKAVALKALAGVALIGAAAALATNPVLLPIGIVAGRRKRSELYVKTADPQTEYILQLLRNHFPKVYVNGTGGKIIMSPRCAARLTCEIQRNYLADLDEDVELLKQEDDDSRHHLTNLIRNNILNANTLNDSVKKLIQAGMSVGSSGGDCKVFPCGFIKTGQ